MYPEWVERYRGEGKEIKYIRGKYYLYERTTVWDKEKKQPRKISGQYLGRITEKEGLVAPKKRLHSEIAPESIPNKEYGASASLDQVGEKIKNNLKKYFPNEWENIWTMAILRLIHSQPFRRIENSYQNSYLSVSYPGQKLSRQTLTSFLSRLGNQRQKMVAFMKEYGNGTEHILIDGTRITSYSEHMNLSQVGYNPQRSYDPQVTLIYALSMQPEVQPVYYRVVPGSICDVTAFQNSVDEAGLKNMVIIADKGFGSKDNLQRLEDLHLQYIIPLKRSNTALRTELIRQGHADGFENYFVWQDRPIFYFSEIRDSRLYAVFVDDSLRVKEETDYIRRIEAGIEGFSRQGFAENRLKFGSLLLVSNLNQSPKELYLLYKTRSAIEQSFDFLKTLLDQDKSYMQSDTAFEAWAFINHISLMLCYCFYSILRQKDILKKYALADVFQLLSYIRKIYINDSWILSEIPKKSRLLLRDLDFSLP